MTEGERALGNPGTDLAKIRVTQVLKSVVAVMRAIQIVMIRSTCSGRHQKEKILSKNSKKLGM